MNQLKTYIRQKMTPKNRARLVLISFGALLYILIFKVFGPWSDKLIRDRKALFDSTYIQGRLSYIGYLNHGTGIKIAGDERSFLFYPYTNKELNDGKIFDNLAQPGDSVLKPPYADVLILFKNGKTYRYTFNK